MVTSGAPVSCLAGTLNAALFLRFASDVRSDSTLLGLGALLMRARGRTFAHYALDFATRVR